MSGFPNVPAPTGGFYLDCRWVIERRANLGDKMITRRILLSIRLSCHWWLIFLWPTDTFIKSFPPLMAPSLSSPLIPPRLSFLRSSIRASFNELASTWCTPPTPHPYISRGVALLPPTRRLFFVLSPSAVSHPSQALCRSAPSSFPCDTYSPAALYLKCLTL